MRAALKRRLMQCVPPPILRRALTLRSKWLARQYRVAKAQEVFTDIYDKNRWGSAESVSGPGSEMTATRNITLALPRLIKQYGITSILDAPCGDFHWMQNVDLAGAQYVGGDIVKELTASLSQRFAAPGRRFMHPDLVNDALPPVDLIFCRDCFIHLPFELINKALANFRKSGAKYALLTTYKNMVINFDTSIGGARGIDLCAKPFNLPLPTELIQEDLPSAPGAAYKCMGLWPVAAL
jgi:SAM-dependent methyltransferase